MEKKYILALSFLLFLPWLNVVYSFYTDEYSLIGSLIPPNKCVALVKLELEKKSKLVKENLSVQQEKKKEKQTEVALNTKPKLTEKKELEKEIERKALKNMLVVGDSLGEGLYLSYHWKIKKNLKCFHVKFLVKHSTTTRTWLRNKKFFKELASGNYDTLVIVLGANEWGMDKTYLYYNINKLYMKIKETNPNIDIYWVVPATKNKYLKEYVEEALGKDKTIAIEDYLNEIPLSKDKVHPDMRKRGYTKLWYVILQRILTEKVLNCQR